MYERKLSSCFLTKIHFDEALKSRKALNTRKWNREGLCFTALSDDSFIVSPKDDHTMRLETCRQG